MTTVSYLWHGRGEVRRLKTLPEVRAVIAQEGGSYETVYKEELSQEESYCRPGASTATKWKNYKF